MTKVYSITLCVIDTDNVGDEHIWHYIENTKYPNYCIHPMIQSMVSREIVMGDDHPLHTIDGQSDEFTRIFSLTQSELDK